MLTVPSQMLPVTFATGLLDADTSVTFVLRHMHKHAAQSQGSSRCVELPHRRPGGEGQDCEKRPSHPRGFEVPSQLNREGSLPVLCRLAAGEERQERLLRIIRPHSLREHVVLKFHCLLQLFA